MRLGSANVKQIIRPAFTAKEIFKIQDDGASALVREIGFANICFAAIAPISLAIPSFRLPAAIAGGLFFGLDGMQHIARPRAGSEETFAMVSDVVIFLMLGLCVSVNLL